ncbi:hypothetical protein Droror1_Dr00005815 [Drosera rotundifolia]
MDQNTRIWGRRRRFKVTENETMKVSAQEEPGPICPKDNNTKTTMPATNAAKVETAEAVAEERAGREKAEAEAAYLREELEKALKQGVLAEERLARLDVALEDCMDQIDCLRRDHDNGIHDAVGIAMVESEKEMKKMEGKLNEANRRVTSLASENTHLTKALLCKEMLIAELDKHKGEVEAEFEMLLGRIDTAEKENTYLKYECSVLEKELEIRNEEREYSRRSADMLHKQYMESVKEITRLDAECQKLRVLVSTRGRGRDSGARRRLNPVLDDLARDGDGCIVSVPEVSGEKIDSMLERLRDFKVENKTLKGILAKREDELRSSMVNCAQALSRLAQVEAQVKEISEGKNSMQMTTCSIPDNQSEGCPLEMEKLAIVATDTPSESTLRHRFWLHEILRLMIEEHHASNRSFGELLNDIKVALACGRYLEMKVDEECYPEISGFLTWGSPHLHPGNMSVEKVEILKDKLRTLESEMEEMEMKLHAAKDENEKLMSQLKESNGRVEILRLELETVKGTKVLIEDQIDNQRLINEDLDTQLTVARVKMSEILQKLSSLEMELEDKNNCCEELEAACLELQLQLEILSNKGTLSSEAEQDGNNIKTDWEEVLACSVKMMDCQGCKESREKQLKGVQMEEASVLDKVFSSTSATITTTTTTGSNRSPTHHSSLRDYMLAEDNAPKEVPGSLETKEVISPGNTPNQPPVHDYSKALPDPIAKVTSSEAGYEVKQKKENTALSDLAVVQAKKSGRGFGFIRKLFLRRKKGSSIKAPVPLPRNISKVRQSRELFLVV